MGWEDRSGILVVGVRIFIKCYININVDLNEIMLNYEKELKNWFCRVFEIGKIKKRKREKGRKEGRREGSEGRREERREKRREEKIIRVIYFMKIIYMWKNI